MRAATYRRLSKLSLSLALLAQAAFLVGYGVLTDWYFATACGASGDEPSAALIQVLMVTGQPAVHYAPTWLLGVSGLLEALSSPGAGFAAILAYNAFCWWIWTMLVLSGYGTAISVWHAWFRDSDLDW